MAAIYFKYRGKIIANHTLLSLDALADSGHWFSTGFLLERTRAGCDIIHWSALSLVRWMGSNVANFMLLLQFVSLLYFKYNPDQIQTKALSFPLLPRASSAWQVAVNLCRPCFLWMKRFTYTVPNTNILSLTLIHRFSSFRSVRMNKVTKYHNNIIYKFILDKLSSLYV